MIRIVMIDIALLLPCWALVVRALTLLAPPANPQACARRATSQGSQGHPATILGPRGAPLGTACRGHGGSTRATTHKPGPATLSRGGHPQQPRLTTFAGS